MPINPGNSAIAEDVHPIHEYHDYLRSEGYKYAGSKHDHIVGPERTNTYKAPGKPKVEVTSHHIGFHDPSDHPTIEGAREVGIYKTRAPKISSKVYNPKPKEIDSGVFAISTSAPGGLEGFKKVHKEAKKEVQ